MGTKQSVGSYAPDFEIPGVDGTVHHLARYLERFQAVGVIIMCNHCPYVRLYLDRLKQLQRQFAERFTLIGINANDEQLTADSFEQMKAFSAAYQLNFPYLRDLTQDVAQSFGATRTPEAFLVDRSGIIRYSGSIDDNPEVAAAVQEDYFQTAITQLLSDRDISCAKTEPIGCLIQWR